MLVGEWGVSEGGPQCCCSDHNASIVNVINHVHCKAPQFTLTHTNTLHACHALANLKELNEL